MMAGEDPVTAGRDAGVCRGGVRRQPRLCAAAPAPVQTLHLRRHAGEGARHRQLTNGGRPAARDRSRRRRRGAHHRRGLWSY